VRRPLLFVAVTAAACGGRVATVSESVAPPPKTECEWERHIEKATVYGLAVDPGGDLLVTGTADEPVGTRDYDAFLARFDTNGALLWRKQWGDSAEQWGGRVAVGPSHEVWLTASGRGAIDFGGGVLDSKDSDRGAFLAKLTPSGEHQWSRRFGGRGLNSADGLAVDRDGNVIFCGGFDTTIDLGGGALPGRGDYPFYIAKLDASGRHLWSKSFGSAFCRGLTVDSRGRVTFTGDMHQGIDFGGGALPFVGESSDGSDIFVAAFEPDGTHAWSRSFGSTGRLKGSPQGRYDSARAVATTRSDEVLVTGEFTHTIDFGGGPLTAPSHDIFVLKLTREGGHVFSRAAGADDSNWGYAIAAHPDGKVSVAGLFSRTVAFGGTTLTAKRESAGYLGSDAFMAGLDESGEWQWARAFGGAHIDSATGAAVDRNGDAVFTGYFSGATMLDGSERAGGSFLMKRCPQAR
jgi:hypothetical protein